MKTFLCYGMAVVGFGVVFLAVMRGWAMTLNYATARLSLYNLLRSNPKHALQYCRSVPNTFLDSVAGAIVTAAMAQSTDPKMIAAAAYPGYDAGAQGASMAWKAALGKAKLGAGVSCAALGLAISSDLNPILFILVALCSVGGLGWLFWSKMEAERVVVLARHEVLPEVERVFVEGRYG